MKNITFFLFIALSCFSNIALSQNKKQLFNQKDLSGWYAFNTETGKQDDASKCFSVDENMIRLNGSKAGYLMSEQSFSNFILSVEFRWNTDSMFIRASQNKNSGVMYLVPENTPDELWPCGYQFQIKEGATGDFILLKEVTLQVNGEQVGPGASVVSPRFGDAAKPIGEWNTMVVTVKAGKVSQKLNGQIVNEGKNPSVSSGRILLQYEGYPIDFRKVEVVEIK